MNKGGIWQQRRTELLDYQELLGKRMGRRRLWSTSARSRGHRSYLSCHRSDLPGECGILSQASFPVLDRSKVRVASLFKWPARWCLAPSTLIRGLWPLGDAVLARQDSKDFIGHVSGRHCLCGALWLLRGGASDLALEASEEL